MAFDLAQRYKGTALVTGASAGIGESFVRSLAAEGMDVVLVSRRAHRLEVLAGEIRQRYQVKAYVIEQDLSEPDAATAVKRRTDMLGLQISMLVNNAGFGTQGRFQDSELERQLQMIDLNCRSYVALSAVYVPEMVARGNGAVIITASTAAFQPVPNFTTYGATKAFTLSFGEALAEDLQGTGVDVLTLCPSYTKTEFHHAAQVKGLSENIQWAEPADVVKSALNALGVEKRMVHRVPAARRNPLRRLKSMYQLSTERLSRRLAVAMHRFGVFIFLDPMYETWALFTAASAL